MIFRTPTLKRWNKNRTGMAELREVLRELWIPESLVSLILDYQQLTLSPELDPQLLKKALAQVGRPTINAEFQEACVTGHINYAKALWPHADIAPESQSATEILDLSIRNNRRKMVQYLIEELSFRMPMTVAWLYDVILVSNLETVEYLLDTGLVDLNSEAESTDLRIMISGLIRPRRWVVLKFILQYIHTAHYLREYPALEILGDVISGHVDFSTFRKVYQHLVHLRQVSPHDHPKLMRPCIYALPDTFSISILKFLVPPTPDWTTLLCEAVSDNRFRGLELLFAEFKFTPGQLDGGKLLTVALNRNLPEIAKSLVRWGLVLDIKAVLAQDNWSLVYTAAGRSDAESFEFILEHLAPDPHRLYREVKSRYIALAKPVATALNTYLQK